MDKFTHFAVASSKMALEDSNINVEEVDMNRFGVVLGSGVGGIETFEKEARKLFEKGPSRVSPFFIPMMITNIGAGQISIATGAKGPNTTVVTACASSTHAIGDAFRVIQRGDADIMFAGGAEASITKLSIAGFCAMKALSTRNDDPKTASRPFDKNRDGIDNTTKLFEKIEEAKTILYLGDNAGEIIFDTNDLLDYDKTSNTFDFSIGGASKLYLSATDLIAKTNIAFLKTDPVLQFDSNDYFKYISASNVLQLFIASTVEYEFTTSELTMGAKKITGMATPTSL